MSADLVGANETRREDVQATASDALSPTGQRPKGVGVQSCLRVDGPDPGQAAKALTGICGLRPRGRRRAMGVYGGDQSVLHRRLRTILALPFSQAARTLPQPDCAASVASGDYSQT